MRFAAFRGEKYLSLETFKKSGQGVKTPVWFASDPTTDLSGDRARLYIYTIGVSGKVKRIRNNGQVRIAPCSARGDLRGEWIYGRAKIVLGDEAQRGMALLNKKYFPLKQILGLLALLSRRERVVMCIEPA
jgi:uncharacterized protein